MNINVGRMAALSVLFNLAACGGGGTSTPPPPPPPAPSAEGAYSGALAGGTLFPGFRTVILEDGELWTFFGLPVSDGQLLLGGFAHGTVTYGNGTFTTTRSLSYDWNGGSYWSYSATFSPGVIGGTIVDSNSGNIAFSGSSAGFTPYDYETAAAVSSVAGAWSWAVTSADHSGGTATIGADGSVVIVTNGCTISGSIGPRPSGKNVFNVTLTAGASPCATPGLVTTGIGLYVPIKTGNLHQLLIATDAQGGNSFGMSATR